MGGGLVSRVVLPSNLPGQLKRMQSRVKSLEHTSTANFTSTACLASAGTAWTLANSTLAKIPLSVEFDNGSNWDATNHVYVCPFGGVYLCAFQIGYDNGAAGLQSDLYINGVRTRVGLNGPGTRSSSPGVALARCADGDTLALWGFQSSGGSITGGSMLNTYLSIVQVA